MSKQNNEAKELATKVAQLRLAIAPNSDSEITILRFKGDPGETFPITWSTEDSGNEDPGNPDGCNIKVRSARVQGPWL